VVESFQLKVLRTDASDPRNECHPPGTSSVVEAAAFDGRFGYLPHWVDCAIGSVDLNLNLSLRTC
jgi:hypothetical protein